MFSLKSPQEIEIMAEAGKRLASVLSRLIPKTVPGATTDEIDAFARSLIKEAGATPAFLNYHPYGARTPYPKTICASVNDVVVHGVPSAYEIKNGDIVKIDIGLVYKKFYADMAVTLAMGSVTESVRRLIASTKKALDAGIEAARSGNTLGDIGHAIQSVVEANGFSTVQGLTGHGIGLDLHEDPSVFNFGTPGEGEELVPGIVLALEPMVAMGTGRIRQTKDDAYATADGSLSAHFEHTVAITKDGPRVLTRME